MTKVGVSRPATQGFALIRSVFREVRSVFDFTIVLLSPSPSVVHRKDNQRIADPEKARNV
ncbi:MAG: hypothetical protein LH471_06585 [Salinibacterium sp.]|nr:hypothetical protein [Salinibacterium sp.]